MDRSGDGSMDRWIDGSMDQGLSGLSGLSADRRMEEECATHASVHLNPEELGRHELERGDGMEVGSDQGCATHASVLTGLTGLSGLSAQSVQSGHLAKADLTLH